jgi:hypothetical protein
MIREGARSARTAAELYGGLERQGLTIISGREWLERRESVGKIASGSQMPVLNAEGEDCAPGGGRGGPGRP